MRPSISSHMAVRRRLQVRIRRPSIRAMRRTSTKMSSRGGSRRTSRSVCDAIEGVDLRLTGHRYPEEVNVDDAADAGDGTGANTPAGEPEDDFFSSWDKPAIKRPSNPPSRTGTPANMNRTASPFLNANGNGNGAVRPKSPLVSADGSEAAPPVASRAISSSAIRKTGVASKPKANILGAKKAKLGAKKVDASALDFDEAEKKAREEAERKERLGYDPDEGATPSENQIKAAQPDSSATTIHQPTPVNPPRTGGFGSTGPSNERSNSDMERLGMGVRKLGFGQVGGDAAKGPAPKAMGFGSTSKAPVVGKLHVAPFLNSCKALTEYFPDDSERYARNKFGTQKGISSDEFFGREAFDPNAQAEAKGRLQGFEGATSISSNAYFGRPEEDDGDLAAGGGDLETAARDFVRKFGITAGDDIENVTAMLGDGAQKLQGAIRNYLNG